MITENQVVQAVVQFLKDKGYACHSCGTQQKGDDVVAVKCDAAFSLYIEAKGETSDRPGSNRYGKPFTASQCQDHVAKAFYRAAEMQQCESPSEPRRVGIALADTELHRMYIARIGNALQRLEVALFWVDRHGNVKIESPWSV
jgi:hypothetical protein